MVVPHRCHHVFFKHLMCHSTIIPTHTLWFKCPQNNVIACALLAVCRFSGPQPVIRTLRVVFFFDRLLTVPQPLMASPDVADTSVYSSVVRARQQAPCPPPLLPDQRVIHDQDLGLGPPTIFWGVHLLANFLLALSNNGRHRSRMRDRIEQSGTQMQCMLEATRLGGGGVFCFGTKKKDSPVTCRPQMATSAQKCTVSLTLTGCALCYANFPGASLFGSVHCHFVHRCTPRHHPRHPHLTASPSAPQVPRHSRSSPPALLSLPVKVASSTSRTFLNRFTFGDEFPSPQTLHKDRPSPVDRSLLPSPPPSHLKLVSLYLHTRTLVWQVITTASRLVDPLESCWYFHPHLVFLSPETAA